MSNYALIYGGQLLQIDSAEFPVNPAFVWADVTTVSPAPQPGWSAVQVSGAWTFSAPPGPPAPTLAEQAEAASLGGLTIALSGTVTMTGARFPTDLTTQQRMAAVIATINATGAFPGGATSYPVKDIDGAWHALPVEAYKVVAGAMVAYISALDLIADGNPTGATALPESKVALTV